MFSFYKPLTFDLCCTLPCDGGLVGFVGSRCEFDPQTAANYWSVLQKFGFAPPAFEFDVIWVRDQYQIRYLKLFADNQRLCLRVGHGDDF